MTASSAAVSLGRAAVIASRTARAAGCAWSSRSTAVRSLGLLLDLLERPLLLDQLFSLAQRFLREERAGPVRQLLCLVEDLHDLQPAVPELVSFSLDRVVERLVSPAIGSLNLVMSAAA